MIGQRQCGVALLAAVLVVAIATILIAGLLDRGQIGQARALQFSRSAQAYAFQQGLELWAARLLREDLEQGPGDNRSDVWAQPMPPMTVPDGVINGRMYDMDGCLDLNSLWREGQVNTSAKSRFERLLRVLELDAGLVDAIIDWIDADGVAGSAGAEDAVYATLDPPRRAANAPFAHVSELRAVAGITVERYERLSAHVCARPVDGSDMPLNVNTASPAVLMSLHDGIGSAVARRLYNDGRARYASTDDFRVALNDENLMPPLTDREIGVSSRYFVAEAEMILGGVPIRLYSLLERDEGQRIRVIARSQGRF